MIFRNYLSDEADAISTLHRITQGISKYGHVITHSDAETLEMANPPQRTWILSYPVWSFQVLAEDGCNHSIWIVRITFKFEGILWNFNCQSSLWINLKLPGEHIRSSRRELNPRMSLHHNQPKSFTNNVFHSCNYVFARVDHVKRSPVHRYEGSFPVIAQLNHNVYRLISLDWLKPAFARQMEENLHGEHQKRAKSVK